MRNFEYEFLKEIKGQKVIISKEEIWKMQKVIRKEKEVEEILARKSIEKNDTVKELLWHDDSTTRSKNR